MSQVKSNALGALIGVLTDPGGTFGRLKESPNVLVPLLTLGLVNAFFAVLTISKARDLIMLQMAGAGEMPPEQVEMAVKVATYAGPAGAVLMALVIPVGITLVLLLVGPFTDGEASFKGLLCLVGYSLVPTLLRGAVTTGISLVTPAQDWVYITTSLALALPREQFGTTFYRILTYVDPFTIWCVFLLVAGHAVFNSFHWKKSARIIVPLYLVYVVVSFFAFRGLTANLPV